MPRPERGLAAGLAMLWLAGPLAAQSPADPAPGDPGLPDATQAEPATPDPEIPESASDRLDRLERERAATAERERALAETAAALGADIAELKRRAIETAAAIQEAETRLSAAETEKAALERRAFEVRADLDKQRGRLERIVAVLQRMGRSPPPALIVRPDDATAAARSAMVLSAVVPHLEAEAGKLAAALSELTRLSSLIEEQTRELEAQSATLAALRVDIDLTLAERDREAAENALALEAERDRLRTLAAESKDLATLIGRLSETAPQPGPGGTADAPVMVLSAAAAQAGLRFEAMKGAMPWPVAGDVVSRFNRTPDLGIRAPGLVLRTRPGAQVVSPVDGQISFADVYRGYGNLLIISTGEGYHILLSGLARIDGQAGQWILAGEPVGVMGASPSGSAALLQTSARPGAALGADGAGPGGEAGTGSEMDGESAGATAPGQELYIEFQRKGVAIDPEPWFASRRKVSG